MELSHIKMVGKQRISQEQKDKILEGYRLGYSSYKTAEYACVSPPSVLYNWKKAGLEVHFKKHGYRLTEEKINKIYELHDLGCNSPEVAKSIGCSNKTVLNYWYKKGLKPNYKQGVSKEQKDKIFEGHVLGYSAYKTAKYAGVTQTAVCYHWKKDGLELHSKRKYLTQEQKDKIFEGRALGYSAYKTAEYAGVSQMMVRYYWKKDGLELHSKRKYLTQKQKDKIFEGHALGYRIYKTAKYAGVSGMTVSMYWEKEGLKPHKILKDYTKWMDLNYCLKIARIINKKQKLDRLPNANELFKLGYGSLATAITNYHGGYKKFREILGEKVIRHSFSEMSNEEFILFVKSNYNDLTISELRRANPSVYPIILRRNLMDELERKKIIIRKVRKAGSIRGLSNEKLIDIVKGKFFNYTIKQLEKEDSVLLEELRKRSLLENLVDQNMIIRELRPCGFYFNKTNDELINYTKNQHQGKYITAIENDDCTLIAELRKRGLIDFLVTNGIIIRKIDKNPFLNMSNKELTDYISNNFGGSTLTEICNKARTLYREIKKRDLKKILINDGIIILKENKLKEMSQFPKFSDEEIIHYAKNRHYGESIGELQKNNTNFYRAIRKRNLIDKLVDEGILKRKTRKNRGCGFFKNMSNGELIEFIKKKYQGKIINEFRKEDDSAYNAAITRGLLDKLVEDGTLIRSVRNFKSMPDKEFINYIRDRWQGNSIYELQEDDCTVYRIILKRGLLDKLVEDGTLIRKKKMSKLFRKKPNEYLIEYIKENHQGKTIGRFLKDDQIAYGAAINRGLIDKLVEDGILIRKRIQITKKVKETLETIADWSDEEKIIILGALPSHKKYSGDDLRRAIKRDERYPKATLGPLKVNYDTNRQYDVQQQVYDLLIMNPKVINDKKALDLLVNKIFSVHQGKVSNNPDTIDEVIEGIRKILEDVR